MTPLGLLTIPRKFPCFCSWTIKINQQFTIKVLEFVLKEMLCSIFLWTRLVESWNYHTRCFLCFIYCTLSFIAEDLATVLMEMVKQVNKHFLTAKVCSMLNLLKLSWFNMLLIIMHAYLSILRSIWGKTQNLRSPFLKSIFLS